MDVYLLDSSLNKIHIIDNYKSLIWANRYNDLGDCELMLAATVENLSKIKQSMYIAREDDDMVCKIERIELDTDIDSGDYLIITGADIKKILSQRIVWKQVNFNGLVEDYIRKLIMDNVIAPTVNSRKIDNFILDEKAGFTEQIREQVTYTNLNNKIQEIVQKYHWGYKVYVDENKKMVFSLYMGTDRSDYVIFSDDYENLSSTVYSEDNSNLMNIALTAGEGEGADRVINVTGEASGLDRYELYVDARDLSKRIDYDELQESYPGGREVTSGGVTYYRVGTTNIAIIVREDDKVEATLTDPIYQESLSNKGLEMLAEHSSVKSFDGSIQPLINYEYKKDYFLGDIVTVGNRYGIEIEARISEVIEVNDSNGYSIQPKLEYTGEARVDSYEFLISESTIPLVTEDLDYLVTEGGDIDG